MSLNPSERKKQTHLRCERQRREAINNGYSELKELLPASSSFVGCKTTNAAILFRAADYVKALNSSIEKSDDELSKLQTQYAALEMILQQYEHFSMDSQPFNNSALQIQMLQNFLDTCFESFRSHVDASNYQSFTKSLLLWVERLDFQRPADELLAPIFKNQH
ncbi:helix-loop-helix DNA-binding domain-containing protein [Ditylenchus destructor]|uniref:Helix-loop-helix DNA-binding domain-containing protein n=1 Tax=Ditylenchus destructor TaxID=166010 RepID=A0AAD4NGU1_9BILA|nr:helix-loop-helix DNA-binding domain-containing protein [Ditylenchus destructor]